MNSNLDLKILTARKGYEFSLDDLRLTMFSAESVYMRIKEAFFFQAHGLASPSPTFGPVGPTIPPGLVLQMGIWAAGDNTVVPVRFLHVEATRIVIDVAGPSSAATAIYQRLLEITDDVKAPDGSPIIGQPLRILNFSELSASFSSPLENLFAPSVRTVLSKAVRESSGDPSAALLPSVFVQPSYPGAPFDGTLNVTNGHTFSLSARGSLAPEELRIFSSAPLETDAHIRFLGELADVLTSPENAKAGDARK